MIRRLLEAPRCGAAKRSNFYLAARVRAKVIDERDEIAVAREEDHGVELRRCGDRVDRHADVPVGLLGAAEEDLEVLGAGLNADDVLAAIRKYYPEITEALEALDEVPLMEEAVCPE